MKRFTPIAALAAVLLTVAACGDDGSSSSQPVDTGGAAATSAPTPDTATRDTAGPADVPNAIVSLSPTATETLFALGAGDQVIAVDEYSDYPAEALDKPHDLSGFEPSVEAIAALEPDLVIMQDPTIKDQLEELGIEVWIGQAATTFDDVYAQIEELGSITGHVDEASALVEQMKGDIDAAVSAAQLPEGGLSYYHELDNTFYSVTSKTFIGEVYSLFGLTNIADDAEAGNDYPQLNPEFIVGAAPDLIFLADTKCCGETAETVAARPGWDEIPAVQNGNVIPLDDDLASRWGPRIVDFVTAVSEAVQKATANQ